MRWLCLPDGMVTNDQGEMRRDAVDFYSILYRAEDCSREEELLQGLPWWSHKDRAVLDANIFME